MEVTHAHAVLPGSGVAVGVVPAEVGTEAGVVPAEVGTEAGVVPAEVGTEAGVVPAEVGTTVGAVLAELGASGAETCLGALESGPHAASASASRTNGMTLDDFPIRAFMTIPSRTKG